MSIPVDKFTSDPIIMTAIDDRMDKKAVISAYLQSIELARQIQEPTYRVIDLQKATTVYQDAVSIFQAIVKTSPGSISLEVHTAFVGTPEMAAYFSATGLPFFDNLNAALAFACAQISAQEVVNAKISTA